jgi:Flp pilus assembly protein TadB
MPRSDGICAFDLTQESGEEASVHFTDAFAQGQEASMHLTHFPDRLREWVWPRLENTAGSSGSVCCHCACLFTVCIIIVVTIIIIIIMLIIISIIIVLYCTVLYCIICIVS